MDSSSNCNVFEVEDDSVVNTVTSDIMKSGPFYVTCTPLTCFESWEKVLGRVGYQYNRPPIQHNLSGKYVVWFEVALDQGISYEEFDRLWNNGAQSMLDQRRKGVIEMEIFKVLGERRVYGFSCKKPYDDWETHMWNFHVEDKIYKNAKLVKKL